MELLLNKQELLNLGEDLRRVSIHCRTGCCWLTQYGDSRDHILYPGQCYTVTRRGKVLLMAAARTRLELISEPAQKKNVIPWRQVCDNR